MSGRRRWGWARGGFLAALLLWLFFVFAVSTAPSAARFTGDEAAFVPRAGSAARVLVRSVPGPVGRPAAGGAEDGAGSTRVPASVEHGLFTGLSVAAEVPTPMIAAIRPPEGVPFAQLRWWRQTVSPDSADPAQHLTLRAITPEGILLAGHSGPNSIAFRPALLELPRTVAPGMRWSTSGSALDAGGATDYRHEAEATAVSDPARAEQGCVLVHSTTTLRVTHHHTATWCPREGLVEGSAPMGTEVHPLPNSEWPFGLRTPTIPRWPTHGSATTPELVQGDPTFGHQAPPNDLPSLKTVTSGGTLVAVDPNGGGLTGWVARGDQLATVWWAHPGGVVLSLTALDDRVVVTTSAGLMVAYAENGRRLWSHHTPDLATAGVSALGRDHLVASTLTGDLVAHRVDNGDRIWRSAFDGGSDRRPAVLGDLVLVTTKDETLAAFGLDGTERWRSEELLDTVGVARSGGSLLVVSGSGEALRLDAGTGRVVAASVIAFGADHQRLVGSPDGSGGALVGRDGVRVIDPGTGRELGFVPGATAVRADSESWRVLTEDTLFTLDRHGVEQARLPLTPAVPRGLALHPVDGVLWVLHAEGVTWIR
ncbi:PQQ-binding-like beta-propeller repeat protein [Granulicoccus sp. GXG6511]|uniref:outer membrane protein assembly factor BamB family protein n=1 Tax=Granulicoccus sp. GXG6511 TaxID=3381351 RepID=UPI003D7CE2B2